MVLLTGYGITSNNRDIFLIAALVPLFTFFVDFMFKYQIACPVIYKALVSENNEDTEPASLLLLEFGRKNDSRFKDIFKIKDATERQRKFRFLYISHNFWLKLGVFLLGTIGEITLWIFVPNILGGISG